ncbi:bifunctional adenosylcobalamin biosynthesis protein CobU [Bacillus methanolicus PB1]|uniref:Adenosylcobinamide kinase n=1 Tax=Bacillus methanolicus PB1 TaxID=997296 RepID=I3E078_BACMT|nr:bifunctional adenosylcobinamide kinase/adenosylcobinamide-phosphate guanylyltransferase [Bacillus methanolicus]EIJ79899.1 bifunctional adenosylcobalamin biosynthesis protein CobU [Bacillus methanolicus PB1]
MAHGEIMFITGGVRSGKSSFAEKTAVTIAEKTGGDLHYLACGRSSDPEMSERINRHKMDRESSPIPWNTWEFATNIQRASSHFSEHSVVLLDCLTTLLNNELFLNREEWNRPDFQEGVKKSIKEGILEIQKACGHLLIVSNEVLNEPIDESLVVFTYGKILGQLHQWLVQRSSIAYLVEAGIPRLMKGDRTHERHYDSRDSF